MSNYNICKFVPDSTLDRLNIVSFVLECDKSVTENKQMLKCNRVILVKQGKGEFVFNGVAYSFRVGDLIFGFPGEYFSGIINEEFEYMYIDFEGFRADELFLRFAINCNNRIFHEFDGMLPMWHDSLLRSFDKNIDLVTEGLLLYTFSRMCTVSENPQNSLLNKIISITEEEFRNPELSISEISEKLHYNSKYLSHYFKERMNTNYSEYLRTLRVKYAVSLFDLGVDSIKYVAILSGYNDPMYFSTVFKRIVGLTPKEYLQKVKR